MRLDKQEYITLIKICYQRCIKKFKEKSAVIVNETKIKGKEALYKVAEFGKFKNRLEVIQEHNKIAETAVKETLEKLITLVQVYGEQTSRLPMLFVSSQAEKQLIMKK